MDDLCTQTWSELAGRLVFAFRIRRGPSDDIAVDVTVTCRDAVGPPDPLALPIDENVVIHRCFLDAADRVVCKVTGTLRAITVFHGPANRHVGVRADLAFGMPPMRTVSGLLVWCAIDSRPPIPPEPPDPPPPPEPPVPPDPASDDAAARLDVVDGAHEPVFPYVYMRPWPRPPADVLAQCFVRYRPPADPPPASLYAHLQGAVSPAAKRALAVAFIDGTAPFAPGAWLPDAGALASAARCLPRVPPLIDAWLAQDGHDVPALCGAIEEAFDAADGAAMRALLDTPAYAAEIDRLWQGGFAMALVPGYRQAWWNEVAAMLAADHALRFLFAVEEAPGHVPHPIGEREVRRLRGATLVMPVAVAPLPAPREDGSDGWLGPYAIGELQLVRQRLVGYRLGEVARVENVMRGERLQLERRRLRREHESRHSVAEDESALETAAVNVRRSLYEELRATVAERSVCTSYDNFNTSYGPPTQANLSGSWTEHTIPGTRPGSEDAVRFAQALLGSTVGRIRRTVGEARASSSLLHSEDTATSIIDNGAGAAPLTAVYHWVNKVYETDVARYGRRLLVECVLVRPARRFIRERQRIDGAPLERPPTPAEAGIASFEAVQPANYAAFAALYGVTDVEPPPAATRTVSTVLRGGDETLVALPEGYRATGADVACLSPGPAPVVLVGTERYDGGAPSAARVFGQDGAVPVAVAAGTGSLVANGGGLVPPVPVAAVNVDIVCEPGPALMDAWRIRTHAALLAGYRRRLAAFLDAAGSPASRPGLDSRGIERSELRRGCTALLMARDTLAGPDVPRALQWFDALFEWNEMSYRWFDEAGDGPPATDPGTAARDRLAAFLSAGLARVLLPVAPGRELALLYFLATGAMWEDGAAAPVAEADVALAAELKEAAPGMAGAPERVGDCWEVVVPTTMQLLRDRLPLLRERGP